MGAGSAPAPGAAPHEGLCQRINLLDSILENSPDGVYRRNLKLNRYDYVNPALEQITGISCAGLQPDQLIGMMHPDDRERVRREIEQVCEQDQAPGVLEYRLPAPGGGYRWLSDHYRLTRDALGEPEFLTGNLRDITKAKDAALSAQKSEEPLKALVELMPVGVCLVGFDGRLHYLNRFFQDTFGYQLSDIPTVEQWFLKAYPDPEYRARVIKVFRSEPDEAGVGVSAPMRETAVTCKDGSVRQVFFNRQLAQNYRVITLTDVTESEIMHGERLKLQKLESLGVLAGGIAHDFNNILTGVVGNISLARLLFDARDWSGELLENAENDCQRAVSLAAQLLTFAQGGEPLKRPLDVGHILSEAVAFALVGANVKGVVTIERALHAGDADEAQLRQAFNSLIINALQAMPEGGTLIVCGENLVLGPENQAALPAGNYLRLSFRDEGCGIPPPDRIRIFDPYFSTKSGASGLGLATAHSIIARHGGSLTVSSEAGTGACFTILLPSTGAPLAPRPSRSKAGSPAYSAGGKVLLMDDERVIRNICSKMLECLSYQVTTCSSGEAALALYGEARESGAPYRVVIVDLTVAGGMGGKETARKILDFDPGACLIVSSGYSNDPVLADFRSYGFHAAMPKPYTLSDLEEVLASVP
jgi:two-component system, cell cycle sensor histidine kinase and response regulator CckA